MSRNVTTFTLSIINQSLYKTLLAMLQTTKQMNQYSHPVETNNAAEYINANIKSCYLGMKNGHSYYNVKGIVWEAWQSMGTANLNTRHSVSLTDFN